MPYPIRMITQPNRTVPAQDAYSQYLQQGAQDNQLKDARNFQMDMATHQSNLAVAREREQAALGQQQQVMAAQLQAHRDQSGAYYGQQQAAQQAGIAEQADYRREGIQGRAAVQHTDLQAQLNDIQLGQAEQARLTRLRQARSSVMADPNLADDEKNNLITQIETGLNPLENRQRQSQIIHTNIQSQQAAQQTQQQATLFNQHQEWLGRGIQGQLQTVTDPQTGAQQLFHVDAQGRIQTLDFSQSQQMHQMRMAGGIQDIAQREQMFPGQLQLQQGQINHQNLSNQQIQELLPRLREMHPLHVQALQGEIANRSQQLATMRQQYEQSGQRFPDELAHLQTQTQGMLETIAGHQQQRSQSAQLFPGQLAHQRLTNIGQAQSNEAAAIQLHGLPNRLAVQDALQVQQGWMNDENLNHLPQMHELERQRAAGQITANELDARRSIIGIDAAQRELAGGLNANQIRMSRQFHEQQVATQLQTMAPAARQGSETQEQADARRRTTMINDAVSADQQRFGGANSAPTVQHYNQISTHYGTIARNRLASGAERPRAGETPQAAQERVTEELSRQHFGIDAPQPINFSQPSTMNQAQRWVRDNFNRVEQVLRAQASTSGTPNTEAFLLLNRARRMYEAHGMTSRMTPPVREQFEQTVNELNRLAGTGAPTPAAGRQPAAAAPAGNAPQPPETIGNPTAQWQGMPRREQLIRQRMTSGESSITRALGITSALTREQAEAEVDAQLRREAAGGR